MASSKLRPLTAVEARRSIVNRIAGRVDGLRQRAVRFGLRPYRVFLVWTVFGGDERGEGRERVAREIELLPTPKVVDLTSLSYSPVSAGVLPVGSVRVERISATYTQDQLEGRMVPVAHEDAIPEPYEFFWELREDGRGDESPVRMRFRVAATPMRRASKVDWVVVLERTSEDRERDGSSRLG